MICYYIEIKAVLQSDRSLLVMFYIMKKAGHGVLPQGCTFGPLLNLSYSLIRSGQGWL